MQTSTEPSSRSTNDQANDPSSGRVTAESMSISMSRECTQCRMTKLAKFFYRGPECNSCTYKQRKARSKLPIPESIQCSECNENKPPKLFWFGRRICKDCRHRQRLRRNAERNAERREKIRSFYRQIKEGVVCAHCGAEGPPEMFDFHHLDPEKKLRDRNGRPKRIGMINSIGLIKVEMQKCIHLCACCHRNETEREQALWHEEVNRERGLVGKRKRRTGQRAVAKEFVDAEKLRRGACVDCKRLVTTETCRAFDFDHIPGLKKVAAISAMVDRAFPLNQIAAELEKTEIRCANCHRKVTMQRRREVQVRPLVQLQPHSDSDPDPDRTGDGCPETSTTQRGAGQSWSEHRRVDAQ